jgi:myosin heavy subunit
MYNKGKSPVIILIVLIVLSLILAVAVFYALQKERVKNLKLQSELAEVKTAQKISEAKLAESKKAISGLELQLKEAQAKIDTLTSDLEQEKTARQEESTKVEQLKKDLDDQKKKRADLESGINEERKVANDQKARLLALDAKRVSLEARIKELEAELEQVKTKDVELGTIVVAPDADVAVTAEGKPKPAEKTVKAAPVAKANPVVSPRPVSSFEAKVLVVNKDYNFVVINMGSKDGVRVGDIFSVYHNAKYVGDVKVDKVHDSMAAAGFSSADMRDKVSEGDKVEAKAK